MSDRRGALLLADGRFGSTWAKTAHGLVRGPSRYPIAAVIDASRSSADGGSLETAPDAGTVLDGVARGIPILPSVEAALAVLDPRPAVAVVGIATEGGVPTPELRKSLLAAARSGLDLVNGLHRPLADDPEIASAVAAGGGTILDFRRPRPVSELRFWSGEILASKTPRIAILGTDCAVGKRTTAVALVGALAALGLRAELVTTGQTGWLQGFRHGFLFDATPNDFVAGELEGAILACERDTDPDLVLIEGQASLRHPAGPAGSELLVSAAAHGVVLQHAPGREFYDEYESLGRRLPPLGDEIDLIERYGVEVWAVTINPEGLAPRGSSAVRDLLADEVKRPVFLPLDGDLEALATAVADRLRTQARTLGVGPAR